MKKHFINALRVIGTLIFLYLVFVKADFSQLMPSLININLTGLLFAFIIFFLLQLLSTFRWHFLLMINKIKIGFSYLFHANAVSMLSGLLIPSNFGTDLVRLFYAIKKKGISKRKATVGTIGDRAFGMFTMTFLFIIGLIISDYLTIIQRKILIALLIILVFGSFFILAKRKLILDYFGKKTSKLPFGGIIKKGLLDLEEITGSDIAKLIIISLAINLSSIYYSFFIFQILGVNVPFILIFITFPIRRFISLLPISIGGLGANEITMFALLKSSGVTMNQIIASSGVSYFVLIISSLIYLLPSILKKEAHE